jgi:tetratricopeptide (TPR) repeat protein
MNGGNMYKVIKTILLILVILIGSTSAQGQAWRQIDKGIGLYTEGQYWDAIASLKSAFDYSMTPRETTNAYEYLSFCYVEVNDTSEAVSYLQTILNRDSYYALPNGFEGYQPILDLAKGKLPVNLTVKTNPPNAQLYINGSLKEETPCTIPLVKGEYYTIELRKLGYPTKQFSLLIRKDTLIEVDLKSGERVSEEKIDTVIIPKVVRLPGPPSYKTFIVGAAIGGGIGLASELLSIQFENSAVSHAKKYNIEMKTNPGDSTELKKVDRSLLWSDIFYYSKYALGAVGVFIGINLSAPWFLEPY